MAAPGMIEISLEEYDALIADQNLLEALRNAGVDNWEGWDDAIDALHEGDEDE